LKVVVLDDEEKVCNLILQLVDWVALGMTVVGTAYNGIDGMALVEKEEPDLVITDIRMPGMDGLELIGQVKKKLVGTEFIIISGYHQFEYAHNAIRYGVEDYLLKPIKQSELTVTLQKIAERHQQRIAAEHNKRDLEVRLKSTLGKLRRDFFLDSVLRDNENPPLSLEEVNTTYGYHLGKGVFQILLVKIDCPPAEFSEGMVRMLMEKTQEVLHSQLDGLCMDLELYRSGSRLPVLLNYPETEAQRVRKQVKTLSDELQVCKSIFEVVELSFALGLPVDNLQRVRESQTTAEVAIGQRLIGPKGSLYEEYSLPQPGLFDDALAAWNRQMERAFELPESKIAVAATELLVENIRFHPKCTGKQFLQTLQEAGGRLFTLVKNRCDEVGDATEMEKSFTNEIDLLSHADTLGKRLVTLVETIIQKIAYQRQQAETRPIRDAKRFIADHFRESGISLEQVAQAIGLNASYFSLLFKRETDSGFLEYLTNVRISQAKELLRSTNGTIAQVASWVGYSDTKHFTRLFIRLAGIKPSEYRKLYG
jgi:two-component system response regulator YesN